MASIPTETGSDAELRRDMTDDSRRRCQQNVNQGPKSAATKELRLFPQIPIGQRSATSRKASLPLHTREVPGSIPGAPMYTPVPLR